MMRIETMSKFLNKPITIFLKVRGKELVFNGYIVSVNIEKEEFDFIDKYNSAYSWSANDVSTIKIREMEIKDGEEDSNAST